MNKYLVDLKFDRKTLKFGKSPNTCEFIDFHLDNPKSLGTVPTVCI